MVTAAACLVAARLTKMAPNLLAFPDVGHIEAATVRKVGLGGGENIRLRLRGFFLFCVFRKHLRT